MMRLERNHDGFVSLIQEIDQRGAQIASIEEVEAKFKGSCIARSNTGHQFTSITRWFRDGDKLTPGQKVFKEGDQVAVATYGP